MTRVCRVQPDVPAVHRSFDYRLSESLAADALVGSIVRVPLHGRTVRGWVLDAEVEHSDAPDERLRDVLAVVSAGPPADVVDLCRWAAWRWAGPLATFLRAASPANRVAPTRPPPLERAVYPERLAAAHPWTGVTVIVVAPTAAPEVQLLLAPEGSTIVVDPSAVRAAQLVMTLRDEGREVVTLGSEYSAAHRTEEWDRARGGACVVVGGRASIWAPVPDVAAVIVMDEADEALEEERAPTWNARDVAVERASRVGATIRVVTPAPTVDALVALGEAFPPAARDHRPRWPRVEVVDLRDEEPGRGLLSGELAAALHRTVDRGEQAVCVLNRTGRARLLACATCRELARCERCGATVRQDDAGVVCVRCGTTRPVVCLHCGGTRFRALRPGVGRVRDELAALLPRTEVAMIDARSDARSDVRSEDGAGALDAPVLIGTEAVLHRVRPSADGGGPVGLVALLELDQELLAPRARAAEQALWLLVRSARLLADGDRHRVLLLQTRLPEHEVVRAARESDPALVEEAERDRRRTLGFPPFGGLAELSGTSAAVTAACDALAATGNVTIVGPVDQHHRVGVTSGSRALARATTTAGLCDALAQARLDAARALGRLRVDVDPRRV